MNVKSLFVYVCVYIYVCVCIYIYIYIYIHIDTLTGIACCCCVYIYTYTYIDTFMGILCCCCLVTKLSPAVCDPMKYSLPGSSVHGISQVRILEWVAMPSSRGSSWPRYLTQVFCIARFIFYCWATRETWELYNNSFFGSNFGPIFVLNLSVSLCYKVLCTIYSHHAVQYTPFVAFSLSLFLLNEFSYHFNILDVSILAVNQKGKWEFFSILSDINKKYHFIHIYF